MADAASMLVDACASGMACLDRRELLVATAQALSGGSSAQTLLASACSNGFECLDNKQLLVVTAQSLND